MIDACPTLVVSYEKHQLEILNTRIENNKNLKTEQGKLSAETTRANEAEQREKTLKGKLKLTFFQRRHV